MSNIIPLAQNTHLVTKDGYFTIFLKTYLDSLQARIGGVNGGIYNALAVNSGISTWDLNASPIASIVLANGTNTLTILNQVAGYIFPYRLTVIQPSSGAAGTIAWPAAVKFPSGTPPTLSSSNNAVDILWFQSDGVNIYLTFTGLNYS